MSYDLQLYAQKGDVINLLEALLFFFLYIKSYLIFRIASQIVKYRTVTNSLPLTLKLSINSYVSKDHIMPLKISNKICNQEHYYICL